MKSEIVFGDEKVKKESKEVDDGRLLKQLKKAFEDLEQDVFAGIQIPKKLIPKEYIKRFGVLANLWNYNLPGAWRLIYTVKNDKATILSVVLEWMDHKTYERRFKY